jgi:hypothetical protein
MRAVCALAVAIAAIAPVHAVHAEPASDGAVALLPLDADARLELYGQPVASELARALIAGGIEVVVIGPKMEVSPRARLIVDGTIKRGAGDGVALSVRVRDRTSGVVLDKLEASAPSLTQIDRAAAELSARVLPSVKTQLAALDARTSPGDPPRPQVPHAVTQPPAQLVPGVVVAVGTGVLEDALRHELEHAGERRAIYGTPALGAAVAFALDSISYVVEDGTVPFARARVHVKVEGRTVTKPFDRVVVTDTVVGDKNITPEQLAERTARAVLDILAPHLRRAISGWK